MAKGKSIIHDYKFNFVDKIGPTYCGAKWYNATIWLGHGQTTSCHHPPSHPIDLEEIKTNPSAIHNTKHKKEMRKMMLNGVRPNECEYCWKIEDMGKDHISDRVMKTKTFSNESLNVSFSIHSTTFQDPMVLCVAYTKEIQQLAG